MHPGTKIRAAREAANLTQRALGTRSRIGAESISFIECGHKEPRLKTLRKIAKALGVDVKELV